jgi:hypothetical protein
MLTEAGITPNTRVSAYTGTVRPKVLLSRLTLRAGSRDRATASAFSFCIDQAFTRSWRGGDVVHIARTGCGLGLSVLRDDRLLSAIGAVTAVPHGEQVAVRFAEEAIREATAAFRRVDPQFTFRELPIEIQIGSERRVLYGGSSSIGNYDVYVDHGFYAGLPGRSECVALSLSGSWPHTAASCSALLLEYRDLTEIVPW